MDTKEAIALAIVKEGRVTVEIAEAAGRLLETQDSIFLRSVVGANTLPQAQRAVFVYLLEVYWDEVYG